MGTTPACMVVCTDITTQNTREGLIYRHGKPEDECSTTQRGTSKAHSAFGLKHLRSQPRSTDHPYNQKPSSQIGPTTTAIAAFDHTGDKNCKLSSAERPAMHTPSKGRGLGDQALSQHARVSDSMMNH
jgi:hypothetical protein